MSNDQASAPHKPKMKLSLKMTQRRTDHPSSAQPSPAAPTAPTAPPERKRKSPEPSSKPPPQVQHPTPKPNPDSHDAPLPPPRTPAPPVAASVSERVPAKDGVNDILRKLDDADHHRLFIFPVTEAIAPNYFQYVSHPMDIKTIRNKNQERAFSNWEDVWNHIMLIFDNARRYNPPDSIVYTEADRLQPYAEKLLKAAMGDGYHEPPGKRRLKGMLNQIEQEHFGLPQPSAPHDDVHQQANHYAEHENQIPHDHPSLQAKQPHHHYHPVSQQSHSYGQHSVANPTLYAQQDFSSQQRVPHFLKPYPLDDRQRASAAQASMSMQQQQTRPELQPQAQPSPSQQSPLPPQMSQAAMTQQTPQQAHEMHVGGAPVRDGLSRLGDEDEEVRTHMHEQSREERKRQREMRAQQQQQAKQQAKQRRQQQQQANAAQKHAGVHKSAQAQHERESGVSLLSTTPEAVDNARPLEVHENRRASFRHVRRISVMTTFTGHLPVEPLHALLSPAPGHQPPDGYVHSLARFASALGPKLQERVRKLALASDITDKGVSHEETRAYVTKERAHRDESH